MGLWHAGPGPAAAMRSPAGCSIGLCYMTHAACEDLNLCHAGAQGRFSAGSFDSLSAVELANDIAAALDLALPGTLVFDYPSVKAIAAHVHGLMAPAAAGAAPVTASVFTAASLAAALPDAPRHQLLTEVGTACSCGHTCAVRMSGLEDDSAT